MWVDPSAEHIFSLFYEYSNLEYVYIHVICRVNQAEYGIRFHVAAFQAYVNTYSTPRMASQTVTDAHGVGWSQTVTDAHGVGANTGAGRHAPQLHELITVHTGWCERLSRLPVVTAK